MSISAVSTIEIGAPAAARERVRIAGMDSFRLFAALCVVLFHEALIPPQYQGAAAIAPFNQILFPGTAAVFIFFIISGFCIHFPYAAGEPLRVPSYLVRRYIRIGLPLSFVAISMQLVPRPVMLAEKGVLWTLYCELVYYTVYPLLNRLFRRFGLLLVLSLTFSVAGAFVFSRWHYMYPWSFRYWTPVVCLPSWVIGCLLADRVRSGIRRAVPFPPAIWRIVGWLFGALSVTLAFHAPIQVGYPLTMILFSIYGYFWLTKELPAFPDGLLARATERIGAASYSLYLTHAMVLAGLALIPLPVSWPLAVAVRVLSVAAVAYLTFKLVERPAHRLARHAGQWLSAAMARRSAGPLRI